MMHIKWLGRGGVGIRATRSSARHAPIRALTQEHARVNALHAPRLRSAHTFLEQRLCGSDRMLCATMGVIGGGVAVSSVLHSDITKHIASLYRKTDDDEEEDSWSGFFSSSITSIKRSVKRALEDDNKKALAALIAANTAVFGLWRVSLTRPALQNFMWRHFACSYTSVAHGKRVGTLLTSAFSHITVPHFGINMFMLWEFGGHVLAPANNSRDAWYSRGVAKSKIVEYMRSTGASLSSLPRQLSLDKFMLLYFSSAIASSALSIVVSNLRGTPGVFTIGASGAVMGVFTVYCMLFPARELMLYGLFEITAADALKLTTVMNVVGSAFQRIIAIDCVGHLGGQAAGLVLNETKLLQ